MHAFFPIREYLGTLTGTTTATTTCPPRRPMVHQANFNIQTTSVLTNRWSKDGYGSPLNRLTISTASSNKYNKYSKYTIIAACPLPICLRLAEGITNSNLIYRLHHTLTIRVSLPVSCVAPVRTSPVRLADKTRANRRHATQTSQIPTLNLLDRSESSELRARLESLVPTCKARYARLT